MIIDSKKLLIRLTFLIFFILALNILAHQFYWYSSLWWFDMPMHFMGGLWLGLAWLWLLAPQDISFKSILKIILLVLFIGVLWEVFEVIVDKLISHNRFNTLDTLSAIFFDLAGGTFAIFYYIKKIMFTEKSKL